MSNILVVESKNDQFFIDALVRYLNLNPIKTEIIVHEYELLEGSSEKLLTDRLKYLKKITTDQLNPKIGIILDQDNHSVRDRINFVNKCVQEAFNITEEITQITSFIDISSDPDNIIQLACYFINVDGTGELETLLKAIKTQPSIYADCLESWKECLESQEKTVKEKDFDKFWLNNYLRFDTCSKEEQKQAARKCSLQYVMENKPHIWDFEHPLLEELKAFLRLFSQ